MRKFIDIVLRPDVRSGCMHNSPQPRRHCSSASTIIYLFKFNDVLLLVCGLCKAVLRLERDRSRSRRSFLSREIKFRRNNEDRQSPISRFSFCLFEGRTLRNLRSDFHVKTNLLQAETFSLNLRVVFISFCCWSHVERLNVHSPVSMATRVSVYSACCSRSSARSSEISPVDALIRNRSASPSLRK